MTLSDDTPLTGLTEGCCILFYGKTRKAVAQGNVANLHLCAKSSAGENYINSVKEWYQSHLKVLPDLNGDENMIDNIVLVGISVYCKNEGGRVWNLIFETNIREQDLEKIDWQ